MTKKQVVRAGLAALAGIALCTLSYSLAAAQQSKLRIVQTNSAGDNVHIIAGLLGRGDGHGIYQVVRLLPSEGDEQQYRIKSPTEPHERVAKQSQLERAA